MKGGNDKVDTRAKSRGESGGTSSKGNGTKKPDLTLTPDQRDLVLLRDELYGGSWEDMLVDLKNRLAGKPYIFKLVNRIQQDIEMMEKLRALEQELGIDLRELL